ncbi:cytochrome oxidase complex assembly protein 1-domain-containing protein [Hyaloraphidium curvatum]|nr:cytochrome oxidase complex assembly protein 1-domain-containing protein [Hyaloraphidium curvatum]
MLTASRRYIGPLTACARSRGPASLAAAVARPRTQSIHVDALEAPARSRARTSPACAFLVTGRPKPPLAGFAVARQLAIRGYAADRLQRPMPRWLQAGFKAPSARNQRLLAAAVGTIWLYALYWYYMHGKRTTSVFKTIMFVLKQDARTRELVGDGIQQSWTQYVGGSLNEIHGKADCTFTVTGSKGSASVHVVARREQSRGSPWTFLTFDVTKDGKTVSLVEAAAA